MRRERLNLRMAVKDVSPGDLVIWWNGKAWKEEKPSGLVGHVALIDVNNLNGTFQTVEANGAPGGDPKRTSFSGGVDSTGQWTIYRDPKNPTKARAAWW